MMKVLSEFFTLFIVLAVLSAPWDVRASQMNVRPVTLGSSWDNLGLQHIFDEVLDNGGLDAIDDQRAEAVWQYDVSSGNDSGGYFITSIAGHTGNLGIYSTADHSLTYDLTPDEAGTLRFNVVNNSLIVNGAMIYDNFGTAFGFYWYDRIGRSFSYTEDDRNYQESPLAAAYLLKDGTTVDLNRSGYSFKDNPNYRSYGYADSGIFTAIGGNDWLLAFEDLPDIADPQHSDNDKQDALFLIRNITSPTPEPATIFLVGLGLIGLAGGIRRK